MEGLIGKAPELVALLMVVFMFLRYMNAISAENFRALGARDEFIRVMHEDHMKARTETRIALEQNAIATVQNTHALNDLRETFQRNDCANFVPKHDK